MIASETFYLQNWLSDISCKIFSAQYPERYQKSTHCGAFEAECCNRYIETTLPTTKWYNNKLPCPLTHWFRRSLQDFCNFNFLMDWIFTKRQLYKTFFALYTAIKMFIPTWNPLSELKILIFWNIVNYKYTPLPCQKK